MYILYTQMEVNQVLRSLYHGDTAKCNNDGEWSASQILMDLLQDKDITEGILLVTR